MHTIIHVRMHTSYAALMHKALGAVCTIALCNAQLTKQCMCAVSAMFLPVLMLFKWFLELYIVR